MTTEEETHGSGEQKAVVAAAAAAAAKKKVLCRSTPLTLLFKKNIITIGSLNPPWDWKCWLMYGQSLNGAQTFGLEVVG